MEPTLGQIKEYLVAHNVSLEESLLETNDNFQLYGENSEAEKYFQYYLEHSVEIHEWLNKPEEPVVKKM